MSAADTMSSLLPASPFECKCRSSCTDQNVKKRRQQLLHSRLRLHKCKMQRIVFSLSTEGKRMPNGEPVRCMPSIRIDSSFSADNGNADNYLMKWNIVY